MRLKKFSRESGFLSPRWGFFIVGVTEYRGLTPPGYRLAPRWGLTCDMGNFFRGHKLTRGCAAAKIYINYWHKMGYNKLALLNMRSPRKIFYKK